MKNVEDFYPLSPLQQGMLFHGLYAPESGMYVEQLSCTLRGSLHINAFKQAWNYVLRCHPVLRTAFVWEGVKDPVQVVFAQVQLPWEQHDWRALTPAEQQVRLEEYRAATRQRGIQLSEVPLMRMALIQTDEDRYHFIWTYHHILLDGWSMPLVMNDIMVCYTAFSKGKVPRLAPTRPYRDYIIWLWQQDLAAAETFWRQELAGFTEPTRLWGLPVPTRDEGADDEPFTPCNQAVYLPRDTSSALQALAQQNQLTLNTLIQGVWGLLLSRYSDEDDVVFGATVSGRPAEIVGIERMVGLFINTLPVRVRIIPDLSLVAWLKQLQQRQLEQHRYEYSSLVQIQGWSEVPRNLPLFESLLIFENYPTSVADQQQADSQTDTPGRIEVEEMRVDEKTNYPVTVVVGPGESLMVQISYDSRRIDGAQVARTLEHFQVVIEALLANIEQRLDDVSILTDAERRQLLVTWNTTEVDYPPECLHHLVEAQVRRAPDAIAVGYNDTQMTYAELDRRANQLAHYLRCQGVRAETLVGIRMERSPELVIGLLGILKAGGAYVPLDPSYPPERLAMMLEDSGAPVLLARATPDVPPTSCTRVIHLDRDWPAIAQSPTTPPAAAAHPDHAAYVLYTSGSTGRPKGVVITHRAICNHMRWMHERFPLSNDDAFLQKTPFSFDASVSEFYAPLMAGARLILARPGEHRDSEQMARTIAEQRITVLQFVPTQLRLMVEEPAFTSCSYLRRVFCGGEALPAELAARLTALFPGVELHNLYGPTEASIDATSWAYSREQTEHTVPIGRPIANMQAYILDRHLRPAPNGVPGELYLGGVGLARGYHNRPQLTAERFLPNPFSPTPGTRLYRTGDHVRYQQDGAIEFLGRVDHQVKLHGLRIELGEIEAVLLQHHSVKEAVADIREEGGANKFLTAYIVCRPGATTSTSELRSYLKGHLPEYMIPSAFVILDALPLNTHGKHDRRALPAPTMGQARAGRTFVPPRNNLELQLVHLWESVFDIRPIGVKDNFFELGGHSLLAIRVTSEIKKQFGCPLPLSTIFQTPTIEHIAALLREQAGDRAWSPLLPLQPAGSKPPFFCIHPILGIAWGFADLARHLGDDQPFYGLQARGLEDGQEPHTRMEEMAAFYIDALRAVQPHGPYFLGGYSFGGYVAFEMAQQLQRQGEEVGMLVIIDTACFTPSSGDEPERDDIEALIELAQNLESMSGKDLGVSYDDLRGLSPDEQLNRVREWLEIVDILPVDVAPTLMRGFQVIGPAARKAHQSYTIQPYAGPILLLRTTSAEEQQGYSGEIREMLNDPTYGWQRYASQPIEVRTFPCNHTQMIIEPYVQDVAKQLQACLEEAYAPRSA